MENVKSKYKLTNCQSFHNKDLARWSVTVLIEPIDCNRVCSFTREGCDDSLRNAAFNGYFRERQRPKMSVLDAVTQQWFLVEGWRDAFP